jgi:predicted molibdopterin-dependent oxidoreductase YjgC
LIVLPVTRLYNRERTFRSSEIVHPRVPEPYVGLHPYDAGRLNIEDGMRVAVKAGDSEPVEVTARVSDLNPTGVLVLPRHLTDAPTPLTITTGTVSIVRELSAV